MAQELQFKWNGKEISVPVDPTETVAQIKHKLEQETHVASKRQKILGLKTKDGKMAQDTALVSDLVIKPGTKMMLMG
jgi:ubiquitin-like domain-containing CTD phosphatase 1